MLYRKDELRLKWDWYPGLNTLGSCYSNPVDPASTVAFPFRSLRLQKCFAPDFLGRILVC